MAMKRQVEQFCAIITRHFTAGFNRADKRYEERERDHCPLFSLITRAQQILGKANTVVRPQSIPFLFGRYSTWEKPFCILRCKTLFCLSEWSPELCFWNPRESEQKTSARSFILVITTTRSLYNAWQHLAWQHLAWQHLAWQPLEWQRWRDRAKITVIYWQRAWWLHSSPPSPRLLTSQAVHLEVHPGEQTARELVRILPLSLQHRGLWSKKSHRSPKQ